MENPGVEVTAEAEIEPNPPLMMISVEGVKMLIGPTLYQIVETVTVEEGETLDQALTRRGWVRRYAWMRDPAGVPWSFGVKVTEGAT